MSQVNVTIMGMQFTLACKDGEEPALLQAVELVDRRMAALRDTNKVRGGDRIAVMVALGFAAELLEASRRGGAFPGQNLIEVEQCVASMHQVLDRVLDELEQPGQVH